LRNAVLVGRAREAALLNNVAKDFEGFDMHARTAMAKSGDTIMGEYSIRTSHATVLRKTDAVKQQNHKN
jgi:hypothetical protein